MAYRRFSKVQTTEVDKSSILISIKLETVRTGAANAPQVLSKETWFLPQNVENDSVNQILSLVVSPDVLREIFLKRPTHSREATEGLRSLIALSFVQLLSFCRKTFDNRHS